MPMYDSSCCTCESHLQKAPSITAQPLIQPGSAISILLLNFAKKISFRQKFRSSVGSKNFSYFSNTCIQPSL
jgi:hypothetical protein